MTRQTPATSLDILNLSNLRPPSAIDQPASVIAAQPHRIWVINPFDLLPHESDVPLRYWALCRTLAARGHAVVWWSSDFSHLNKSKRSACPDTDGFAIRLVETPVYSKNISLARLRNHQAFAHGFYAAAMACLESGEFAAPTRMVVSLPPLGVAEQACKIRDFVNRAAGPAHPHFHSTTTSPCEVVVDIMDAWPETFYRVIPKPWRNLLGPHLLAPMHRSAMCAYQSADKITAVGQSYLNLAKSYLATNISTSSSQERHKKTQNLSGACPRTPGDADLHPPPPQILKPMFLCYHGTDLSRFQRDKRAIRKTASPGKYILRGPVRWNLS